MQTDPSPPQLPVPTVRPLRRSGTAPVAPPLAFGRRTEPRGSAGVLPQPGPRVGPACSQAAWLGAAGELRGRLRRYSAAPPDPHAVQQMPRAACMQGWAAGRCCSRRRCRAWHTSPRATCARGAPLTWMLGRSRLQLHCHSLGGAWTTVLSSLATSRQWRLRAGRWPADACQCSLLRLLLPPAAQARLRHALCAARQQPTAARAPSGDQGCIAPAFMPPSWPF